MATTKTTAFKLPSVLAFSRKLEVSDALMASGLWSDIDKPDTWQPIALHEKRNRATHSQFGGVADAKKPNLSWGDDATLPHDADTLRISFTLKTLGQLEDPTACNEPEFEEKVNQVVKAYRNEINLKNWLPAMPITSPMVGFYGVTVSVQNHSALKSSTVKKSGYLTLTTIRLTNLAHHLMIATTLLHNCLP